jgi:hypothetical protein
MIILPSAIFEFIIILYGRYLLELTVIGIILNSLLFYIYLYFYYASIIITEFISVL